MIGRLIEALRALWQGYLSLLRPLPHVCVAVPPKAECTADALCDDCWRERIA